MGKKAACAPSKISSATNPAASGATIGGNKSSILRSAFSPSEYQLALFASVIQGLDAQHIRVHDVNTGRLRCEHAVGPKEVITSLDWGTLPGDRPRDRDTHSKKKRKRSSGVNGATDGFDSLDAVVAFGTSTSDIRFYSPSEDKVISVLSDAHEGGVKDFKFTAQRSHEGWSIGNDNKLVQWDLRTSQKIR
jgi:U3 small nucleolar RNA-associated protein 5